MAALVRRYARTHVPFVAADVATRWDVPVASVVAILAVLASDGDLIAGHFRPGGADREYCHPEVLQRLRRRSLAALRREVEAVPAADAGQVPPRLAGRRLGRARAGAAHGGDHAAAGHDRRAVSPRARHPPCAHDVRRPRSSTS